MRGVGAGALAPRPLDAAPYRTPRRASYASIAASDTKFSMITSSAGTASFYDGTSMRVVRRRVLREVRTAQ